MKESIKKVGRPPISDKKQQITIALPVSLIKRLTAEAEAQGISRSALIINIINQAK